MAPRLQCLTLAREFKQAAQCLRAFSTSQKACANGTQSEASALLNSLSSSSNSSSSVSPIRLGSQSPASRTIFSRDTSASGNSGSVARASRLIDANVARQDRQNMRRPGQLSASSAESLEKTKLAGDLSKQIMRRWKSGDVYAPHDLSPVEMKKWKTRSSPHYDVFDVLDLNPLSEYKNFSVLSEYMSPMGRIKHSRETGLRPVNQRRVAKAIRRSIGMGIMPSVHRHPEILQKEVQRQNDQLSRARLVGL